MNHPWLIFLVPPRSMLRHDLSKQLATGLLALIPGLPCSVVPGIIAGVSESFDEAHLLARAWALATRLYRPRSTQLPKPLVTLGWDGYQSIGYCPDRALQVGQHLLFEVRLFYLGLFFKSAVQMHEVVSGHARLTTYDPAMFDYGQSGLIRQTPPADLGFAGFRLTTKMDPTRDVAAFLGTSYLRAVGRRQQYDMSARDLTIDTELPHAEELPGLTKF